MNRKDFQKLSKMRIAEARALLKLHHYSGAYYLAGYAVECALKACIAKEVNRHDFPDRDLANSVYTHKLKELMKAANLQTLYATQIAADKEFETNWKFVESWSEGSRYETHSSDKAKNIVGAISNPRHGVLPWIKRHW